MTINSNYNFGLLSSGGSNLKEIQFTLTADGVLTILQSVSGYNLTYATTGDNIGLTLTSTLNKAFIVFVFPSIGTTFRPYIVKNGSKLGELNDITVYTFKVPSEYNTLYFPDAKVAVTQSFTFLILD